MLFKFQIKEYREQGINATKGGAGKKEEENLKLVIINLEIAKLFTK